MENQEKDPLLVTINPIKLNRIIIALCLFSFIIWPVSQFQPAKAGVPVVDDAQQSAILYQNVIQSEVLITMQSLETEMTTMQKAIDVAEKSSEFIQQAKTISQFASMVSAMICSQHNLKLLMKRSKLMKMCKYQLQFQMAMLNYSAAIDIMKMIMHGGLKMDQGIRVTNLKNAIELLNTAYIQMQRFQSTLYQYDQMTQVQSQHMTDIYFLTSRPN